VISKQKALASKLRSRDWKKHLRMLTMERYRFPPDIRAYVHDSSERQPGCRLAAADYQRLDPDAEEGHWRFGVVQPSVG